MSKKQKDTDLIDEIDFYYLKSPYFRVIRVNGVWGGVTPQNEIQVVIYNERFPIPDLVTHKISDEGQLLGETGRKIKDGLVREVEAVLSIDPKIAKALGIWFLEKAEESEKNNQELREAENIGNSLKSDKIH